MKVSVYILLLFALFGIFYNALAQDKPTDSLNNILKTSSDDTTLINTNLQLFNYYVDDETDKAKTYALVALSLAQKIKNEFLTARSEHSLGVCYNYLGNLDSSLYYFNNAATIYTALKNEEKLLEIRKKYKPSFEKILGAQKLNDLYNAERDFRTVLIRQLKSERDQRGK